MSRGIELQLKTVAMAGGFFCAFGVLVGIIAREPQPHPIFWYRVFGAVCGVTSLSCLFLPSRNRYARWAAVGSLSVLGGLLAAIAATTWKMNSASGLLSAVLTIPCYRGVRLLLSPAIRDYFNTDY